jgi:hypothetical protein
VPYSTAPKSGREVAVPQVSTLLAAAPAINSTGVVEWVVKNLIPLVLLVVGIGIIASARKGKLSDNANTVTNVIIGMCVIAGAGLLFGFAGQLTNLIFS